MRIIAWVAIVFSAGVAGYGMGYIKADNAAAVRHAAINEAVKTDRLKCWRETPDAEACITADAFITYPGR